MRLTTRIPDGWEDTGEMMAHPSDPSDGPLYQRHVIRNKQTGRRALWDGLAIRSLPQVRSHDPAGVTLLREAIAATGRTDTAFAQMPGISVDPRTLRRWLAGERSIPMSVLSVCSVLVTLLGSREQ